MDDKSINQMDFDKTMKVTYQSTSVLRSNKLVIHLKQMKKRPTVQKKVAGTFFARKTFLLYSCP